MAVGGDQNPEGPLNIRQERFCQEYILDFNGTQAAIRAGYSLETAGSNASGLLSLPKISLRVERVKAERLARVRYDADKVLSEMSLLAHSNLDHYYITDDGQVGLTELAPEGAMRAIQSIKKKTKVFPAKGDDPGHKEYDVEIRLWDKPTPLKLMGRHVGLFPDRVEVTGRDGQPLDVALSGLSSEELAAKAASIAAEAALIVRKGDEK